MCNQSLQEVNLFMGLQSYRRRTLSYVLERPPAAPSIQQGTIIWSSRCAQYNFFPAIFHFCYNLRPFLSTPFHFLVLCPCSLGGSGEQGMLGRRISMAELPCGGEQCQAVPWDALGEAFPLNCSAHFGLFSSGYKTASGTSFTLVFSNIEFAHAKWCQVLGPLPFFFFFFCLLPGHSYWHRKK